MSVIILSSSPLVSDDYEQGIELTLTATDFNLDYKLIADKYFCNILNTLNSDHQVIKKLKQLELFDLTLLVLEKVDLPFCQIISLKEYQELLESEERILVL